ncbi:MAG TPA: hypothetical protein VLV47_01395 [Candidatus Bathyarchaeia archaeon]|nr:hypothetical protein [Candidatus Bathyarchaeia archaeon]
MPGSEVAASQARGPSKVAKRSRPGRRLIAIGISIALATLALALLAHAGSFLTIHAPERSDVIVVLDGEWPQAVKLQKEGYAPRILLDVGVNRQIYGRMETDLAIEFLQKEKLADTQICPVVGDSTYEEVVDVRRCLNALHATSAILVAPNFNTRRVISTFRTRLPQYRWSIAASSAPYNFAAQYWKYRSWAKTVLNAWEDYLWWKLVEERRADVVLR